MPQPRRVERVAVAGAPRERRTLLAADVSVEVTQRTIKVAKAGTDTGHRSSSDYDSRQHFRLSLHSGWSLAIVALN